MNLPPLNTILAFIAVVEHGRFNKAASSLALSESAVSHQIRKLEETLGVRLMERGRDGPNLTNAGEQFYLKASIAVKQLQEVVYDLQADKHARLVVTLPPSLATLWFSSNLWSFYEANSQAEISILPTERVCNLVAERIDLAIRYASNPDWEQCEWLGLWDERIFPIMTPDKAAELKKQGWEEFSQNTWFVQNQLHQDECSQWCKEFGVTPPPKHRIKTLQSFDQVVNATLTGQCIAMGRTPMVDQFIEDERLVSPFGPQSYVKTGRRYYAVWSKLKPNAQLTEKLLDWLQTNL